MAEDQDTTPKPPIATPKARRARWWVWPTVVAVGAVSLGTAVAFDDWTLTSYQLRFLDVIAKVLAGGAVLFGAFRYLDERSRRLAWDKTRFIVELFEDFDEAEQCQVGRRLMDRAYHTNDFAYLEHILGDTSSLSETEWDDRDAIDRFLEFFDRLYTHVYITGTLIPADVSSFSGYVIQIRDSKCLSDFALRWGYEDVLEFAQRFRDNAAERVALVQRWRTRLSSNSQ